MPPIFLDPAARGKGSAAGLLMFGRYDRIREVFPSYFPDYQERVRDTGALARTVFPRLDPEAGGIVVAAVSPFRDEHCGGLVGLSGSQRLFSGVVGRHSEATFALPADRGLSLRHGILIARITDDGCPVLRVLDLRSGTGMSDAEGEPHHSVIANGPLRLRMGNSALFAIPADALFRKAGPRRGAGSLCSSAERGTLAPAASWSRAKAAARQCSR